MNIVITTTIDDSDNAAPELANKIEIAIDEFLQSDDLREIVGDTPYHVIVKDKDSKDIN
jgi:non-homologous end joining protein Ku